jgi:aminoglycoside phosphotransferase family enzyme
MPTELPKDAIESADAAVAFAQQVRRFHRRRTARTAHQRAEDIERALERLREAMAPLRSEIGRFPYGPQTDAAEANREAIRERSAAIQRERRKLWKMKTPTTQEA